MKHETETYQGDFLKQTMDMSHNIGVIMQFAIYPILLGVVILAISNDNMAVQPMMLMMISTSFISITPILKVRGFISNDKSQNVLRILIMANVKPMEYILGINVFIVSISICASLLLGLIGGLVGIALLKYVLVMILGVVTTLVLGSALTLSSSLDSVSGAVIALIALLNSILPLLSIFNPSIQKISYFIYTYQINNLIGDIYGNFFDWKRVIIIVSNLVLFFIGFVVSYKKSRLLK